MDISGPHSVSLDIELDSDIYPAPVTSSQVILSNSYCCRKWGISMKYFAKLHETIYYAQSSTEILNY